ncbi:hypothetical protein BDR06DRAFT_255720 [Suillus hirtellus]|nr:hypothetical protein BDR06DRAFT_255720 [Suillus hirtellus]
MLVDSDSGTKDENDHATWHVKQTVDCYSSSFSPLLLFTLSHMLTHHSIVFYHILSYDSLFLFPIRYSFQTFL